MRATEVGVLLAWSRSRRQLFNYKELVIRVPVSLCLLVFLMPFTRTAISGVDGEIDSKYRRCCGMPLNTSSKCWTEAACICVDCENRAEDTSYGMEFCSSFPLNGILKNSTICQEWQSISLLQKKDKEAERNYNNFEGILQRIDCGENWETYTYSTASTCRGCLEAYKNWICYTKISEAIDEIEDHYKTHKRRQCLKFCETVLQKCPYLPPNPPGDEDLVQVGYSAFNCYSAEELIEGNGNDEDCRLSYFNPMEKCKQSTRLLQSIATTVTPRTVSASNSISNSTSNDRR